MTILTVSGNFVGPLTFREQDAPAYARGFIVTFVTAIVAGLLALLYRVVCVMDNKKRDGTGIVESFDHAYEDDMTDAKVCGMDCVEFDRANYPIRIHSSDLFCEIAIRDTYTTAKIELREGLV